VHVGVSDGSGAAGVTASAAAAVQRVLTVIADVAAEAAQTASDLYGAAPPLLRCIAPLDTAAQRLVATQALGAGYRLQVPSANTNPVLPAAKESEAEAARLLAAAEAAISITGDAASRQLLRDVVLDHSDVLVVFEDPDAPPSPRELVNEARRRGLTAVVIGARAPHVIRVIGEHQAADWAHSLRLAVAGILDPFRMVAPNEQAAFRAVPLRYFTERPAAVPWYARLNTWFERTILIGWRASPSSPKATPGDTASLSSEPALMRAFTHADALATRYAHFYRSAFVLRYLFIVPMAIGWCFGFFAPTAAVRTVGFAIQWLAVVGTLSVTMLAKRTDWHPRFTAYRSLAELLRHQLYLARFGRVLPMTLSPAEHQSPASIWIAWQFRSIVRQQALGKMSREPFDGRRMAEILRAFLDGQCGFYRQSAARYAAIADRVWKAALGFFWGDFIVITLRGFVIGVMRTLGWSTDPSVGPLLDWWEDFLNEIDIVLPCLAWIILAIVDQGEYSRLAEQYAGIAENAEAMREELDRSDRSYASLVRIAVNSAVSLTGEVSRWRLLIAAQEITYADL
jgi:hypothetical protein